MSTPGSRTGRSVAQEIVSVVRGSAPQPMRGASGGVALPAGRTHRHGPVVTAPQTTPIPPGTAVATAGSPLLRLRPAGERPRNRERRAGGAPATAPRPRPPPPPAGPPRPAPPHRPPAPPPPRRRRSP